MKKAENITQKADPEFFGLSQRNTRAWRAFFDAANLLEEREGAARGSIPPSEPKTKTLKKRIRSLRRCAEKMYLQYELEAKRKNYEV